MVQKVVRIIGGRSGGRKLKRVVGETTRPTSDRVRQAIFNMLASHGEPPERVLDLYAGTGAMGLEALSRGASSAILVESDRAMCGLIGDNAAALGFAANCQVVCAQVLRFLDRTGEQRFGWVFLDPPYALGAKGELDRVLAALSRAGVVAPEGLVAVEHDFHCPPKEIHGTLVLQKTRRYGQTQVSLFEERR